MKRILFSLLTLSTLTASVLPALADNGQGHKATFANISSQLELADIPGQHPHYLNARTDLRKAEQLLNIHYESNVAHKLHQANSQVQAAIRAIDTAVILDGKNIDDHPPIDTSLRDAGRLHEVLRLLYSAHRDLAYNESNVLDFSWRDKAFKHIAQSIRNVKEAIRLEHWDEN